MVIGDAVNMVACASIYKIATARQEAQVTKASGNRKIEAHMAKIKFHTAELIAEILRHDPDDPDTSAHIIERKYDYLDARRDVLSHDAKEKSVTILDPKKLATLLCFMGEMGLLKGKAYEDYLELRQPSKAEIGAAHSRGYEPPPQILKKRR